MKNNNIQTPLTACSFDYYPGDDDRSTSVRHSAVIQSGSFAYRGPKRPLPVEPRVSFDISEADSAELNSTGSEDEALNPLSLSSSRNRPNPTHRRPKWRNLTFSEKLCKLSQKFPYGQFVGFVMCFPFSILFAVNSHLSFDKLLVTLQEVMHMAYTNIETIEILSTALGVLLAALSALVFCSALISTYHGISSNSDSISSPTPSLMWISFVYPAVPIWCILLGFSLVATMTSMIIEGVCATEEISGIWHQPNISTAGSVCKTDIDIHGVRRCLECIDFYPVHFLFPAETRREDMEICGREIYLLCKSDMPDIVQGSQLCSLSAVLVLLGLCMHLLALSYNRVALQEKQKMKDLSETIYIRNRVKSGMSRASVATLEPRWN